MDVIFDLDGTLADPTHRLHFVKTKPKNWPAFFAAADKDECVEPIAMVARGFALGNRVLICSGRPDNMRDMTETWLAKWVFGKERWVYHSGLYMRKAGDYRADYIVKSELLDRIIADGFDPKLAFDDRDQCVALWRRRGLRCCQCAEGNF